MVDVTNDSGKDESFEEKDEEIDSPGNDRIINSDLDIIIMEDKLKVLELRSGNKLIAFLKPRQVKVSPDPGSMMSELSLELAPHTEDVGGTGLELTCEFAVDAVDGEVEAVVLGVEGQLHVVRVYLV